eukprot:c17596_g2_i2.p1 GENE.c17596_g2_i2~~c17596_g2_i2.p1  ORF type:complete len:541 (+),score=92.47 c17596_g2_i2:785-2407(+)
MIFKDRILTQESPSPLAARCTFVVVEWPSSVSQTVSLISNVAVTYDITKPIVTFEYRGEVHETLLEHLEAAQCLACPVSATFDSSVTASGTFDSPIQDPEFRLISCGSPTATLVATAPRREGFMSTEAMELVCDELSLTEDRTLLPQLVVDGETYLFDFPISFSCKEDKATSQETNVQCLKDLIPKYQSLFTSAKNCRTFKAALLKVVENVRRKNGRDVSDKVVESTLAKACRISAPAPLTPCKSQGCWKTCCATGDYRDELIDFCKPPEPVVIETMTCGRWYKNNRKWVGQCDYEEQKSLECGLSCDLVCCGRVAGFQIAEFDPTGCITNRCVVHFNAELDAGPVAAKQYMDDQRPYLGIDSSIPIGEEPFREFFDHNMTPQQHRNFKLYWDLNRWTFHGGFFAMQAKTSQNLCLPPHQSTSGFNHPAVFSYCSSTRLRDIESIKSTIMQFELMYTDPWSQDRSETYKTAFSQYRALRWCCLYMKSSTFSGCEKAFDIEGKGRDFFDENGNPVSTQTSRNRHRTCLSGGAHVGMGSSKG